MAGKSINISQQYPRISDPKRADRNCLDDSALVPHQNKIPVEKLKKLIVAAVRDAEKKSGREALAVPIEATEKELEKFYQKEGKKLFDYWKKYVSDPAATAHQMHTKNYRAVGVELFRNRALQKGRMNSGWRHQFLVVSAARETKRFKSISDIEFFDSDIDEIAEFSNSFSDWSFLFENYSCEEIATAILNELIASKTPTDLPMQMNPPDALLESFGVCCKRAGLMDDAGSFSDPHKLLQFFIA